MSTTPFVGATPFVRATGRRFLEAGLLPRQATFVRLADGLMSATPFVRATGRRFLEAGLLPRRATFVRLADRLMSTTPFVRATGRRFLEEALPEDAKLPRRPERAGVRVKRSGPGATPSWSGGSAGLLSSVVLRNLSVTFFENRPEPEREFSENCSAPSWNPRPHAEATSASGKTRFVCGNQAKVACRSASAASRNRRAVSLARRPMVNQRL